MVRRANHVRSLDAEWGLKQVERGEENSTIHKRQPSKVEREIAARGGESYKMNLRELCRYAAEQAQTIYEYRELLEGWGVDTQFRNGRMYVTDRDHDRYSFSVRKLDAALSNEGLEKTFRANVAATIHEKGRQVIEEQRSEVAEKNRILDLKESYLKTIRDAYLDYRRQAHNIQGTELSDFPKLKLSRPPEEIAHDPEVQRTILAYWRGADELRLKMASKVPYVRGAKGTKTESPSEGQRSHERQVDEHQRDNINR